MATTKPVSDAYLGATMMRCETPRAPLFEIFPDNAADLGATDVANPSASLDRVLSRRAAQHQVEKRGAGGHPRRKPSYRLCFKLFRFVVEQKGFEPSTPTLRTWCSPS